MHRWILTPISQLEKLRSRLTQNVLFSSLKTIPSAAGDPDDPLYADIPKPRIDKSQRKPYPTPMKELIKRAKEESEARKEQPCKMLEDPPDNGLLVPGLVKLAHRVYRAQESLISGLLKLVQLVPVQRCRFCSEVHIGHVGHEIRSCTGPKSGFRSASHVWRKGGVHDMVFFPKCFHLFDRVGKPRVVHNERYSVPRLPAIVELCIQAGVDLEKYPARRRTKPVYCIEGRIVDFELVEGNNEMEKDLDSVNVDHLEEFDSDKGAKFHEKMEILNSDGSLCNLDCVNSENLKELSVVTMNSWFEMISGTKKMMEKYKVLTCGYCPEIQVGPKGHKVRMCKASKHQSRNGMHAWQEATIDDLVGPNFVWHVRDPSKPALYNNLKRYYGKAPAAAELCVQAGASVPDQYRSMMRLDVVPPDRDEVDLVA